MVATVSRQGYFSILRWRRDVTRNEAKNVAILLVDAAGEYGGMRCAPLSTVSSRLHEQGMLDEVLENLKRRFEQKNKPTLDTLERLHADFYRSICFTRPQPTAVPDPQTVLDALYRAYAAPPYGSSNTLTKGKVLDRVVDRLRRLGRDVKRGEYLGEFIFDVVVIRPNQSTVMDVLSFGSGQKNWTPVLNDAGHFLYALSHVSANGCGVFEPPAESADDMAHQSYRRVLGWFQRESVPVISPDQVTHPQLSLGV